MTPPDELAEAIETLLSFRHSTDDVLAGYIHKNQAKALIAAARKWHEHEKGMRDE